MKFVVIQRLNGTISLFKDFICCYLKPFGAGTNKCYLSDMFNNIQLLCINNAVISVYLFDLSDINAYNFLNNDLYNFQSACTVRIISVSSMHFIH